MFQASLRSEETGKSVALSSKSEIVSILYGVRYWARNDLRLVDEYFRLDRGAVMFAIQAGDPVQHLSTSHRCIRRQILRKPSWTTLAMQDLIHTCCELPRLPILALRLALDELVLDNGGKVVLIPSAEAFASNTLSATLPGTQAHELGAYYRDRSGRLISHIRFHHSLNGEN